MLKRLLGIFTIILVAGLLTTSCKRSSVRTEYVPEPAWENPVFVFDDVKEIPDTFELDLTNLAPESWSDNDKWSLNPYKEVAKAEPNPNGGYDFTFDTYNQRIIFILDSSQRYKLFTATSITVEIDGEAVTPARRGIGFRYHVGWSEKGSNWNTTISLEPAPFDDILKETINVRKMDPEEQEELTVNFMIQVRGGQIGDNFGEPYTITIRSIKLTAHYD